MCELAFLCLIRTFAILQKTGTWLMLPSHDYDGIDCDILLRWLMAVLIRKPVLWLHRQVILQHQQSHNNKPPATNQTNSRPSDCASFFRQQAFFESVQIEGTARSFQVELRKTLCIASILISNVFV
jgi:hypothetical protein